jgi:microcystin-dependent protein
MTFWKWSKTAASNGTADSSARFRKVWPRAQLNDGTRGMMAAAAKYRDDIAGAIVTGGTSTAYTVSSNQVFDSLAHLDGAMIAFTPHATNGATVTLNVDSLGAKPLRGAPSIELPSGSLILGTPYVATYNNSDAVWYLRGGISNPYSIPLGGSLQYWGSAAPNSSFAFMLGSLLSRTTYATLFSIVGTTYGAGDGSTTFAIPDLRGRVPAGVDDVGNANRLTAGLSGVDGHTLGAAGGTQNQNIAQNQLPNVAPGFTGALTGFSGTSSGISVPLTSSLFAGTGGGTGPAVISNTVGAVTVSGVLTPNGSVGSINGNVSQNGLIMVQPTIICNYIMRII